MLNIVEGTLWFLLLFVFGFDGLFFLVVFLFGVGFVPVAGLCVLGFVIIGWLVPLVGAETPSQAY